jgi:hypothetical protein
LSGEQAINLAAQVNRFYMRPPECNISIEGHQKWREASLDIELGAREVRGSSIRQFTLDSPALTYAHPALTLAQGGCW